MTFPRKVVLTREYGSSFFNNLNMNLVLAKINPYDIVESPALVNAAEKGLSWLEAKQALIDEGFLEEDLAEVDHWGWSRMGEVIVGTVQVFGPYIIEEYDGRESVFERDTANWRE